MVDFQEAAELNKAQIIFSRRLFRAGFTEDLAVELALERWVESKYLEGFLTTGVEEQRKGYRAVTENHESE